MPLPKVSLLPNPNLCSKESPKVLITTKFTENTDDSPLKQMIKKLQKKELKALNLLQAPWLTILRILRRAHINHS